MRTSQIWMIFYKSNTNIAYCKDVWKIYFKEIDSCNCLHIDDHSWPDYYNIMSHFKDSLMSYAVQLRVLFRDSFISRLDRTRSRIDLVTLHVARLASSFRRRHGCVFRRDKCLRKTWLDDRRKCPGNKASVKGGTKTNSTYVPSLLLSSSPLSLSLLLSSSLSYSASLSFPSLSS